MTVIKHLKKHLERGIYVILIVAILAAGIFFYFQETEKNKSHVASLNQSLDKSKKELEDFKNQDQVKINEGLKKDIESTHNAYTESIKVFEKILDLKAQDEETEDFDSKYAEVVNYLADLNYSSSSALLADLDKEIEEQYISIATTTQTSTQTTATVSNSAPASGYSFQAVETDNGTFNVAIIAADLNSTRVIMDTASDSDCSDNCPVLPLGDYVARSGAYAGINGPFFCPADYPSCAGKTNSFDTLLMNKNKHYFNSDNNKYSTVPLVYFTGNTMGARSKSLEWGRDTGVDAVVANFPLYIQGGNNVFGGSSDAKLTSTGARTFVANKGSTAYIGIVYSATSSDAANVLKTLGMDNALGLDQGGSTALWFNGYKAGPGRNLPSALLFVKK